MVIDKYIAEAKKYDCQPDQVKRFVDAGYCATPKQLLFHSLARQIDNPDCKFNDIFSDGTRGSAKSHSIIAQVGIDDCQRVDGLKFLFLRKTLRAASESFEDLAGRVLKNVKCKLTRDAIDFPNGSKIIIGGYKDEADIDKYLGIEYDGLVVEERSQITWRKLEKLYGSVRTSKSNWRPRIYSSSNPGGIGHNDCVKRYILPYENKTETITRRIPSSYKDNPFLNKDYIIYLESLTGSLAQAWRDGNWNIFEGQFFQNFGSHLAINPYNIEPHKANLFGSLDYGESAPTSFGLWHIDDLGKPIRLFSYYKRGLNVTEHIRNIKEMITSFPYTSGKMPQKIFADPSIWHSTKMIQEGNKEPTRTLSVADFFLNADLKVVKANNSRINGWRIVNNYFSLVDNIPNSFYFKGYNSAYEEYIPMLMHDEHNPEDVDTTGEDHIGDDTRYFMASYTGEKTNLKKTEREQMLGIKLNKTICDDTGY